MKNLAQFFAYSSFQISKKSMPRNLKKVGPFFCLSPFQILKKVYLQISKYPVVLIIVLKEIIYIKTIIQIDKHKGKYKITACIPKNYYKKVFTFYKKK